MKRLNLTIIICITLGLYNLNSQKIETPEKVTIADFESNGDSSVYLWYGSVFSFPYLGGDKGVGATDDLFSLKNETYLRILLNKSDTNFIFFELHKSSNCIPKLKSITCYYLNNNKITLISKGKDSVLIINYFEKGYYFDLSSLKDKESNVIVELQFTYTLKSKKEINFYMDRNEDYKNLYIRIDVPEIYKYKVRYDYDNLTEEIKKPRDGPTIGWYPDPSVIHLTGTRFIGKNTIDLMTRPRTLPNGTVSKAFHNIPIYAFCCKLQAYIFKSIKYIDHQSFSSTDSIPSIISFHLTEIHEIRE
jgi:hypothetical protein